MCTPEFPLYQLRYQTLPLPRKFPRAPCQSSPLPRGDACFDFHHRRLVLSTQEFYMKWKQTTYLLWASWQPRLLSFSMMYVVVCFSSVFLFIDESCSIVWMYLVFVYPLSWSIWATITQCHRLGGLNNTFVSLEAGKSQGQGANRFGV